MRYAESLKRRSSVTRLFSGSEWCYASPPLEIAAIMVAVTRYAPSMEIHGRSVGNEMLTPPWQLTTPHSIVDIVTRTIVYFWMINLAFDLFNI